MASSRLSQRVCKHWRISFSTLLRPSPNHARGREAVFWFSDTDLRRIVVVTNRECSFRIYTFFGFIAGVYSALLRLMLFALKVNDQRLSEVDIHPVSINYPPPTSNVRPVQYLEPFKDCTKPSFAFPP